VVDFICFIFLNAVKVSGSIFVVLRMPLVGEEGMMNWKNTPWSSSSTFSGSPELGSELGTKLLCCVGV